MKKIFIYILSLILITFCAVACSPNGNYDPKTVTVKIEFADFSASYKVDCAVAYVDEVITALNTQEETTIIETESYNMGKRIKSALGTSVDLDNSLAYSYSLNGTSPKYGIHECAVKNGDVITVSYKKLTTDSISLAPRNITLHDGFKNIKISINFADYSASYTLKTDGIHLVDAIADLNEQEGKTVIGVVDSDDGKVVNEILQIQANANNSYSFTLNGENPSYGISATTISNGDEISFSYGLPNSNSSITIQPRD